MNFDIKKELQNMFIVESTINKQAHEMMEFSSLIKDLDSPIKFTAQMVPVFENKVDGKKALVINLYDIFRFANSCERSEDLSLSDCFKKICDGNDIVNTDEYVFAVSIPDAQVRFVKEAAEADGNYTKMPTKLGELGRFMKYLKQDCINKGIVLVKEK